MKPKIKNLFLSFLVLLTWCGFSAIMVAQENGVLFRAVFVAKDALGNTDTAIFIVKEGATKGIDEHLGEVNIYGLPPQGPLDLRIVQRTKVNKSVGNFNYWLIPPGYTDGWEYYPGYWEDGTPKNDRQYEFSSQLDIDQKTAYHGIDTDNTGYFKWLCSFVLELGGDNNASIELDYYEDYYDFEGIYWGRFNSSTGSYFGFTYALNGTNLLPDKPSFSLGVLAPKDYDDRVMWITLIKYSNVSKFDIDFNICPNPVNDTIFIKNVEYGDSFNITDIMGSEILSFIADTNPFAVDISELAPGTYILKNLNNNSSIKFIKE